MIGKNFKHLQILVMFISVLLISVNCKKEEVTQPSGDLKVIVCDSTLKGYYAGAEVFLYKTESARTNDVIRTNYYQKATTDDIEPFGVAAIFYSLPYQKYFVFSRFPMGVNYLTGVSESFITSGKQTSLVVVIQ